MTADSGNPLIEGLGSYIDIPEWPALLERDPLKSFPADPTPALRNEYLEQGHQRFAATKQAIRMAYDLQSMMRASYRERDPRKPENIKKLYEIATTKEIKPNQLRIYYSHTRCKLIMGITGVGKSAQLERVLAAFPQKVVHGECQPAGWMRHTQISHMTAKMSSDGSRGGLLMSILAAMDEAAGTDYVHEIGFKQMSIDQRSLRVAQTMAVHSLGMLVIEEMQAENFIETRYKRELRILFLALLSFGIPVVLVGNPRAFSSFHEFKQTERRSYSVEPTELWPYHDYREPDWLNAIAPAIWRYQVVDHAEPFSDSIAKALWECSGGIPAYAWKLVKEVQTSVLLGAAKALTEETLREHFDRLSSFRQFRPLIEGLTTFNPDLLIDSGGLDIPVDLFRSHWLRVGAIVPTKGQPHDNEKRAKPATGDWTKHKKQQLARKKSAESRKKSKRKKNEQVRSEVAEDDLRYRETHQEYLSRSLKELQDQIETDKKPTKGKKR